MNRIVRRLAARAQFTIVMAAAALAATLVRGKNGEDPRCPAGGKGSIPR